MILRRGEFTLTDELPLLEVAQVAALLRQSYWAGMRCTEQIAESMQNSLCLGLRRGERVMGFVRALTDHSINAYICDFIIDPEVRGSGLGKWMFEVLLTHPLVSRTQKLLLTRDAQDFYNQFGFEIHPFSCLRRSSDYSGSSAISAQ